MLREFACVVSAQVFVPLCLALRRAGPETAVWDFQVHNSWRAACTVPRSGFSFKPDSARSGIVLAACMYACMCAYKRSPPMDTHVLRHRQCALRDSACSLTNVKATVQHAGSSTASLQLAQAVHGARHRRSCILYICAQLRLCAVDDGRRVRTPQCGRSTVFFFY